MIKSGYTVIAVFAVFAPQGLLDVTYSAILTFHKKYYLILFIIRFTLSISLWISFSCLMSSSDSSLFLIKYLMFEFHHRFLSIFVYTDIVSVGLFFVLIFLNHYCAICH